MKHHITSFFGKRFERATTYKVERASSYYNYFISEYRGGIDKDLNGNVLISEEEKRSSRLAEIQEEKARLKRVKHHIGTVISRRAEAYSYYVNEYRQNSPVQDPYGNIILFDEIEQAVRKH